MMMKTAVVLMFSLVALVWANPLKRMPRGVPYAKPQIVSLNARECLDAHNDKRALHGTPPLQWDEKLASESAEWALYLAKKPSVQLEHSTGPYGENIYYGAKWPAGELSNCVAAVDAWYDEIKDYNFNKPGFGYNTGHFTQVVWKSTKKVGVGMAAVSKDGFTFTFVVARYTPPGNINTPQYFRSNVLKLRG